jgi:hypothetical protein
MHKMAGIHEKQLASTGLSFVESRIEFLVQELALFFFFASSTLPGTVAILRRRSPNRFKKARACDSSRRIPVSFSIAA